MFGDLEKKVEAEIRAFCEEHALPFPKEVLWNPLPFNGEWGISTSFFQLAAEERRLHPERHREALPVDQRAQQMAEEVARRCKHHTEFSRVEAVKGYLNLYLQQEAFSTLVIDRVLTEGEAFGRATPNGLRVMVEFSQPNTHKAFHVGHLRNVILGAAISNILEWAGFEVVRANYIGDIGLHVIKWLWNYLNYHQGETPSQNVTRWMGDLYAEAERRLDEDPSLESQVRALFARWDQRDPELVSLWEKTRRWSLKGFDQIYQLLGVRFDRVYFESEAEKAGKELVETLIQRGIAIDERPDGPVIIKLDELLGLSKERYRVLVILRSDGTSLYATKDLPLAIQKFQEYDLDRSIYVVDVRQSLYLQQIYKTLEIMGYPWAKNCYHLAYEIVNLPGNVTMSSREGTVVLLEDLIQEATNRARHIVDQKNPDLEESIKERVSLEVALGALKYTMLARENTKVVTFEWEAALNFEGQAAPYIQYAHVRANSILKRLEEDLPKSSPPSHPLHPTEIQLIDWISRVPGEVQRAAQEYKPLLLTNLAYELARAFNDFYNQCPVLKAEAPVREFRLRLVAASRYALANLLNILGISAPGVM